MRNFLVVIFILIFYSFAFAGAYINEPGQFREEYESGRNIVFAPEIVSPEIIEEIRAEHPVEAEEKSIISIILFW